MPCRLRICSFSCTVSPAEDPRAASPDKPTAFYAGDIQRPAGYPVPAVVAAAAKRSANGDFIGRQLLLQRDAETIVQLQPDIILADAALALLMLSRDRHQRNGSVIQPHRHRDRVMVAGTRMEQIDAIAKICSTLTLVLMC